MSVTAHVYPSLNLAIGNKTVNFGTDTLKVLMIGAGTYNWNATSQGHVHVSDFLAGSGSGTMTEVVGGGYSRLTLSSVTWTDSGLISTLGCANPSWASGTFTALYAVFFDNTVGGTDSTNQLIGYWDLGGITGTGVAPFTLTISGSGLLTVTAS